MTTNLAKWASNNGQIIKSGLPHDRREKFLPSVVGFAYNFLQYECYLGNIGFKEWAVGRRRAGTNEKRGRHGHRNEAGADQGSPQAPGRRGGKID